MFASSSEEDRKSHDIENYPLQQYFVIARRSTAIFLRFVLNSKDDRACLSPFIMSHQALCFIRWRQSAPWYDFSGIGLREYALVELKTVSWSLPLLAKDLPQGQHFECQSQSNQARIFYKRKIITYSENLREVKATGAQRLYAIYFGPSTSNGSMPSSKSFLTNPEHETTYSFPF